MSHEHEHGHHEHDVHTEEGLRVSVDTHDGWAVASFEVTLQTGEGERPDTEGFMSLIGSMSEDAGGVIGHIKAMEFDCSSKRRLSLTEPGVPETAEVPGGAVILSGAAIVYGLPGEEAEEIVEQAFLAKFR